MKVLPERHHVYREYPKGVSQRSLSAAIKARYAAAETLLAAGQHVKAADAFLNYANEFHDYLETIEYVNALYMVCLALGESNGLTASQLAVVTYVLHKISDHYPVDSDRQETLKTVNTLILSNKRSNQLPEMFLHTSSNCEKHDPSKYSPDNPESAKRLKALSAESKIPFEQFGRIIIYDAYALELVHNAIKRAHGSAYLEKLLGVFNTVENTDDMVYQSENLDNILAKGSQEAIYSCVNISVSAVEMALSSSSPQSHYAIIRPPGHHAGDARVNDLFHGFCFVNNVMIGAMHALEQNKKVLIVDIDAHTGNGTANMISRLGDNEKANIRFIDIYANDSKSFTRLPSAQALRNEGSCHNYPLKSNFTIDSYIKKLNEALEKISNDSFEPDLIIVSAGFDAHVEDFLVGGFLNSEDFGVIGQALFSFCQQKNIPIIAMTEGGYNLDALKISSLCFSLGISGRFNLELWNKPTAASTLSAVIAAQPQSPRPTEPAKDPGGRKRRDPLRGPRH